MYYSQGIYFSQIFNFYIYSISLHHYGLSLQLFLREVEDKESKNEINHISHVIFEVNIIRKLSLLTIKGKRFPGNKHEDRRSATRLGTLSLFEYWCYIIK